MYRVLLQDSSVSSFQKATFPPDIPLEACGRAAVAVTSSGESYLVLVCVSRSLGPGICLLDTGVKLVASRSSAPHTSGPILLDYSSLKILPQARPIKKATLRLVFSTVEAQIRWNERASTSQKVLGLFLETVLLTVNVKVSVFEVLCLKRFELHSIVIEDIGDIPLGKIVRSTKIDVSGTTCEERYRLEMEKILPEVYGLESHLEELEGLLRAFQESASLHLDGSRTSLKVLVVGADGSGKKSLVRAAAAKCDVLVMTINCSNLARPDPGDTEDLLAKKFSEAILHSKQGPTVLLLVRLESLTGGRLLARLATLLDTTPPSLVVIATSTSAHTSLPAFTRYNYRIFLNIPTEEERSKMITGLSGGLLSGKVASELAHKTPGFVPADIKLLLSKAKRLAMSKNNLSLAEAVRNCLYLVEGCAVRGELGLVRGPQPGLDHLGGLDSVKQALIQSVVWPLAHPQAFVRLNVPRPSGVLLYGPPGCGKTSLARAAASAYESALTFLSVSAADLLSPYVGDAELTLTSLFQRARDASPTLLFIDEIDALVGSREDTKSGAHQRLLSTLLIEMDGVGVAAHSATRGVLEARVTLVGATNRPELVDPALLRPGRLDRLIFVPPPSYADRLHILTVLTKQTPIADCVDLKSIADLTELYSGADLKHLVREAGLGALSREGMDAKEIRQEDFLSALRDTPPSLSPEQLHAYDNLSFS